MNYKRLKYKIFLLLMAFVCAVSMPASLQAAEGNYKVKAVFLFKFFRYISWPPETGTDKTICVYGHNPFGETLDYIIKTKLSSGEYKVNYMDDVSQIGQCQLVFVSQSVKDKFSTVLKTIGDHKGILLVSDIKGFAHKGGGIEFVDHPKKIGLLLNVNAFNEAGLNASSKLMKIVETVE